MNQAAPCDQTIIIEVLPNGTFTYTKKSDGSNAKRLYVNHGQLICWECANQGANFAIDFGVRTPVRGHGGQGRPGHPVKLQIQPVTSDSYKYYVAVCTQGHEQLFMDDPDLIVGP